MLSIKERQVKLKELGYYKGAVDGIVGNLTRQAYRDFQARYGLVVDGIYGEKTNAKLIEVTGTGWNSIKHFRQSEFTCKCGCGLNNMDLNIVRIADQTREHFGKPCIVTSGTRCSKHNKNVGGATNSKHLYGKAIDMHIPGVTGNTLLAHTQNLKSQGRLNYTYKIDSGAVHIDIN